MKRKIFTNPETLELSDRDLDLVRNYTTLLEVSNLNIRGAEEGNFPETEFDREKSIRYMGENFIDRNEELRQKVLSLDDMLISLVC